MSTTPPTTPDALLAAALHADASRPVLTYYDDAERGRVELSAATLSNWVVKTANLLAEGLAVAPGERVAVLLSPHWLTAAVLLAIWSMGAEARTAIDDQVAAVVASEDRVDEALDSRAREVLGLSLAPLGGRLSRQAPGVVDFAAEVPAYGDTFAPYAPPRPDILALDGRTGAAVVQAAIARAAELGLTPHDRVLVTADAPLEDWLLAPLAAGASIVLCRNPDPAALSRRIDAEHVTVTIGTTVEGVRAATR